MSRLIPPAPEGVPAELTITLPAEAMTFNERMAAGYALNGMAQRFLDQAQKPHG